MRRVPVFVLVALSALALWAVWRNAARHPARPLAPVTEAGAVRLQYGAVSLTYAPDLARGAQAVERPAAPFVADEVPEGIGPAHLEIGFTGFSGEVPGAAEKAAVHVYPVARFASPEFGADSTNALVMELTLLEELLDQPAGAGGPTGGTAFMPFMPVVADAAQVLHAKVQRIEGPGVIGFRFLTAYMQETVPFTEGNIFYTFQGLTPDRQHYVAATFPIRTGLLPAVPPANFDQNGFAREAPTYLAHTVADLDAQDDDRFTPSLAKLDALVRTIAVAAAPAVAR